MIWMECAVCWNKILFGFEEKTISIRLAIYLTTPRFLVHIFDFLTRFSRRKLFSASLLYPLFRPEIEVKSTANISYQTQLHIKPFPYSRILFGSLLMIYFMWKNFLWLSLNSRCYRIWWLNFDTKDLSYKGNISLNYWMKW